MTSNFENINHTLNAIKESGNWRTIPTFDAPKELIDLSSNDYLGINENDELRRDFLEKAVNGNLPLSASASRLLSAFQKEETHLESDLSKAYHGKSALLFNSGYHANTGIVSALATRSWLILADKYVHASIIDGIVLSRAKCLRFAHNDLDHLEELIKIHGNAYSNILIIVESVYSMDGDSPNLERLAKIKKMHAGAMLYVDEAHAIGVIGQRGLGMVESAGLLDDVDILVGTFGKALASVGAFAIVDKSLRDFLVNRARSLIFSTALPPFNIAWSRHIFQCMQKMEAERAHLKTLSNELTKITGTKLSSHIQPLIIGDPKLAVEMSKKLMEQGIKVLPIRTPTVPAGTERLRFSLSAALSIDDLKKVEISIKNANKICI